MAPSAARRAFRAKLTRVESAQAGVTASQQLQLSAARHASPDPMGRLGRAAPVPAPLYGASAQGNSAVTSDPRGEPAAQPGKGAGQGIADASPWPARLILTPPSQLNRAARTPASQNGRLIARDRRIVASRGTVMLSGAPDTKPGIPDPDAGGPARPSWRQVNRTISHQIGADSTAALDNAAAKPMTSAGGRRFSLGTRGDPQTVI